MEIDNFERDAIIILLTEVDKVDRVRGKLKEFKQKNEYLYKKYDGVECGIISGKIEMAQDLLKMLEG